MPTINSSVLISDADNFNNNKPINPYYRLENIDYAKIRNEHEILRQQLTKAGINVITVPSPNNCQDGVYTANWALVRGDTAILAQLPNTRQNEIPYAEKILKKLGKKVIPIPDGLKYSGQGDALACGDYLFCGSGYRSDSSAQTFAATSLGYKCIQLQTIPLLDINGNAVINQITNWPDSLFYDIDLALAVIKAPTDDTKGLIAYCPEAFTSASRKILTNFDAVDKIEVSFDEAVKGFATNLISTGKTVIMSAHAPQLAKKLRQHNLNVITPEITELAKGGGYIRCIALNIF